MRTIEQHTTLIKTYAAQLGFDYCGIARAQRLDEDARRLENWLQQGMHGSMQYMENHFELRIDPTKLVPGAQSVITLLLNYYPAEQQEPDSLQVAKYAYGKDYHEVIREKLNQLLALDKAPYRRSTGKRVCRFGPGTGKDLGATKRPGMDW